jgi:type IV pilus biogenesis protein CpaD/CtpE
MNRTAHRPVSLIALLLAAVLGVGCASRTHLTANHGRSMRAAFAGQVANPQAGGRPHKLPGLDAQEAKIVTDNYRRAMSTKGAATEDQGMVILAPSRGNQQPYMPPPSVPQKSQ